MYCVFWPLQLEFRRIWAEKLSITYGVAGVIPNWPQTKRSGITVLIATAAPTVNPAKLNTGPSILKTSRAILSTQHAGASRHVNTANGPFIGRVRTIGRMSSVAMIVAIAARPSAAIIIGGVIWSGIGRVPAQSAASSSRPSAQTPKYARRVAACARTERRKFRQIWRN